MVNYKRAVMCAPDYYDIPAAENPHMTGKQPINKELALQQWTDLVNVVQGFEIHVQLMPPVPERFDMVFTANGGWVHNGRALLSNFRLPIRQGEKKHFRSALEGMGFSRGMGTLRELPDSISWEGQGDVLEGPQGMVFHGWGFRSDYEALPYVKDFLLPYEKLVALHLVNPDFYHLDTCLAPIPIRNAVAFYPKAFHADSIKRLKGLQIDRIELSTFLAYCFAANSPVLGTTVLLNVPFMPSDECRERSIHRFALTENDPRFEHLLSIDNGGWQDNKELAAKMWTGARGNHPMYLQDQKEYKAGYTWFVRQLWARNLNVVPVYTSQFPPSGAGARCCMMLFE